ncbi:MAG: hypothetical protein H6R12_2675 [Proteobacteria bacterium]|nr:hypothetical protein [Pseudomonadota bacterium]
MTWTLRDYDGSEFLGLRQWRAREQRVEDQESFHLSTLHRFVRHPWYSLGLVLLWTRDMDAARLVAATLATGYLVIGSWLEERKLLVYHGERYRSYRQRVPALPSACAAHRAISPEDSGQVPRGGGAGRRPRCRPAPGPRRSAAVGGVAVAAVGTRTVARTPAVSRIATLRLPARIAPAGRGGGRTAPGRGLGRDRLLGTEDLRLGQIVDGAIQTLAHPPALLRHPGLAHPRHLSLTPLHLLRRGHGLLGRRRRCTWSHALTLHRLFLRRLALRLHRLLTLLHLLPVLRLPGLELGLALRLLGLTRGVVGRGLALLHLLLGGQPTLLHLLPLLILPLLHLRLTLRLLRLTLGGLCLALCLVGLTAGLRMASWRAATSAGVVITSGAATGAGGARAGSAGGAIGAIGRGIAIAGGASSIGGGSGCAAGSGLDSMGAL